MRISLIAAVTKNGIIGNNNDLVWRNKDDMAHFKALTMKHVVIMGRNTWESIPEQYRPLAGRQNVVLSKRPNYRLDGAWTCNSLERALRILESHQWDEVFIMGGASVYAEALPYANRLILTEVEAEAEGNVEFPQWDRSQFKEASRDQREGFAFVEYVRVPASVIYAANEALRQEKRA